MTVKNQLDDERRIAAEDQRCGEGYYCPFCERIEPIEDMDFFGGQWICKSCLTGAKPSLGRLEFSYDKRP